MTVITGLTADGKPAGWLEDDCLRIEVRDSAGRLLIGFSAQWEGADGDDWREWFIDGSDVYQQWEQYSGRTWAGMPFVPEEMFASVPHRYVPCTFPELGTPADGHRTDGSHCLLCGYLQGDEHAALHAVT